MLKQTKPLRVVIVTCQRSGTASSCLPAILACGNVQIAAVILAHGVGMSRYRAWLKKLKKIWKIGLLGALNGIRMRSWYDDVAAADIEALCRERSLPFFETPALNIRLTRQLIKQAKADVGLSLGNGFIGRLVFSIPKFGFINIHGERLPEYQNAQSVIWPIYNGETDTGLTVHFIDQGIDTGAILHQERFPIRFESNLADTVRATCQETTRRAPLALSHVLQNFHELRTKQQPQSAGKSYTTPSIWQFWRMLRQHRLLKRKQLSREIQ